MKQILELALLSVSERVAVKNDARYRVSLRAVNIRENPVLSETLSIRHLLFIFGSCLSESMANLQLLQ